MRPVRVLPTEDACGILIEMLAPTPLPSVSRARRARPPLSRAAVFLLVAVVALGVTGCASLSSGDNPFSGEGGEGARSIRIDVRNLNFNDATLHAVSSGSRYRMGTVSGKSDASFEVRWEGQQTLEIEIDLLAGGRHTTRPISVSPQDRVQLVIQPELRRSYVQL